MQLKCKLDPSNNPLQGATFSLYMQGTSGNPDTLVANNLTTGSDGYTDVVGNLLVGNYYFVETSTLDTYLLNGKQVPFTVADTDMAYDSNGQLLQNKVKTVSLVNYMKPTLQKTRTTDESVDIGETVTWKISTDVPLNLTDYTKYVITDTLDTRLTYVGNMSVTLDNAPLNPNLYNVQVNGRVITVTFTDIFAQGNIGAIQSGDKFNIQFDTTVNNTAIPGVQIPNNAVLTMNNGWVDATSTEANPPMVETGGRQFMKVDPNNNPLQGAQFVVSKTNPDNSISYMKQSANLNVTWVNSKSDATVFTSANDGTFQMYGLAYGTYNIEEVKAPGGYNLLNGIQTFTVDPNSYDDDAMILVVNTMAPTIPITGGIGTIIFFAIGLVLMGIVYFFYRRYESQSA
ncbi:SpaH/EbpB family LPXTG-anchored major pilin [Enterococcus rivorum]|uniref:SpaH/EbpB family LPXTG-anchored major pilin n=1 Tax=Enterococcus rivorum TaxID=762845 RepID=UPI00364247F5